jgi:2,3-bisphosphoglycerate-independent phosphoglycerate mutase
MSTRPARALLLFLDGVGIGASDPRINPIAAANLPTFDRLLGGRGPLIDRSDPGAGEAHFAALDACLGVEGLPQSGTGQTSLLAGLNAARLIGRHFGPWVHTGLRGLLARDNLLSRARGAGRSAAFANAYPAAYLEGAASRLLRRPAAPPFAAGAAGVLTRNENDLREGRAVASEIEHTSWRERLDPTIPPITPSAAGAVLARIASTVEVTLFAHYATDTVGHTRDLWAGVAAMERVDAFLGGLMEAVPDDLLLVVASDHGNIEDLRAAHTRNAVPLVAIGPGAGEMVSGASSIAEVTPIMLRLMGIDYGAASHRAEPI